MPDHALTKQSVLIVHSEYSIYYLLVCLPAALLLAYLLYRNNPLKLESAFSRQLFWVLFFLRSASLFVIFALLLGFWLNHQTLQTEKPVITIAIDNSSSMLAAKDSAQVRTKLWQQVQKLAADLNDEFTIRFALFGNTVKSDGIPDFKDNRTDMASMLEESANTLDGTHTGSTILISDGIVNQGMDPAILTNRLGFPVYTVAIGDTNRYKDLICRNPVYPKSVFPGNPVALRFDLSAFQCRNQQTFWILMQNGKEIRRESIKFERDEWHKTINLTVPSGNEGLQHYTLQFQAMNGEKNLQNNRLDFFVQVIKDKQVIGIIAAHPHPDYAAFKQVVQQNPQYELAEIKNRSKTLPEKISLLIAHQIPGEKGEGLELLRLAREKQIPVLFILGAQSGLNYLPELTNRMFYILSNRPAYNEVLPVYNPAFNFFHLEENEIRNLQKLPPLIAPHGIYKSEGENMVMMHQQIGQVITDYPFLNFYTENHVKYGWWCGEGFWKWRLHDQAISQQQSTQILVNRIFQYLIGKNDRNPFRIHMPKQIDESENLILEAEFLNESNEQLNTPDAFLRITHANGNVFSYTFGKSGQGYMLNAGLFQPGTYSFVAELMHGNKPFRVKGNFVVVPARLESLETTANHQMLHELASATGGVMVDMNGIPSLARHIKSNNHVVPVTFEKEELVTLMHLKIIFWIVLGLLTLEWVIRKWNGSL